MKVGEAPSGFRHRAFPGRGHRKALKAEPDAHPVLHDAPSRIKRVRAKGGGRHELHNETNRQEVFDYVLTWIEYHI